MSFILGVWKCNISKEIPYNFINNVKLVKKLYSKKQKNFTRKVHLQRQNKLTFLKWKQNFSGKVHYFRFAVFPPSASSLRLGFAWPGSHTRTSTTQRWARRVKSPTSNSTANTFRTPTSALNCWRNTSKNRIQKCECFLEFIGRWVMLLSNKFIKVFMGRFIYWWNLLFKILNT